MSLRQSIGAAFAAVALLSTGAFAEGFPERPVTVIIPSPAGGSIDTYARTMAQLLEPELGQSFVVENKPGGGGSVGVTTLTNAKPDGYTISFVWDGPLTAVPNSLNVSYTPDDYAPIMAFAQSAFAICTRAEFPADNASEFIAALKAKPGQYTFGLDAIGGAMHLAAARVFTKLGVDVRYVPFGGASEVLKALLGGEIDVYGSSINPILPHVSAGTAKCLAVTSAEPNPALPKTEGLNAIGMGSEETLLWWGAIAPAKTPPEVRDTLEKAFTDAANSDTFKALVAKQGATMRILTGPEMAERIRSNLAAFGEVAKTIGLERQAP